MTRKLRIDKNIQLPEKYKEKFDVSLIERRSLNDFRSKRRGFRVLKSNASES